MLHLAFNHSLEDWAPNNVRAHSVHVSVAVCIGAWFSWLFVHFYLFLIRIRCMSVCVYVFYIQQYIYISLFFVDASCLPVSRCFVVCSDQCTDHSRLVFTSHRTARMELIMLGSLYLIRPASEKKKKIAKRHTQKHPHAFCLQTKCIEETCTLTLSHTHMHGLTHARIHPPRAIRARSSLTAGR